MYDLRNTNWAGFPGERPPDRNRARHKQLFIRADVLFNRARWYSLLVRVKAFFVRRQVNLLLLGALQQNSYVNYYHSVGVRTIRIEHIKGSVSRQGEFDRHFFPATDRIRERWMRIMMARLEEIHLPPVEVIQADSRYFVIDGHHRISVARILGEEFIDADITSLELEPARIEEAQNASGEQRGKPVSAANKGMPRIIGKRPTHRSYENVTLTTGN